MNYLIRPVRLNIIIPFFIVILWNVLASIYGQSFPLFLVVLMLGIGLASIRYKLIIHDNHFSYHVLVFKKTLFTKEVYPKQIREIKFFRVGWAKKAAIIRLHKGMSIRLAVLDHPGAYEHLMEYAEEHEISIRKTRDYLILERM